MWMVMQSRTSWYSKPVATAATLEGAKLKLESHRIFDRNAGHEYYVWDARDDDRDAKIMLRRTKRPRKQRRAERNKRRRLCGRSIAAP
jgi:hypothetical protein